MARTSPRTVAGRYVLGRVLGRGGLSTVYQATDPLLQRQVAVKVFSARADTPELVRLQDAEAKLIAGLNHYALTSLFDAGADMSDPDRPQIYLVMEYIPGSDLRQLLQTTTLTATQVSYLGFDLAEGLDHVHQHGFLHRDLKPANILLASRGAEYRLRGKLTDFGISSVIGVGESNGLTTGTAAYLSPEQVDGGRATTCSDVYALGLVLLESLTGRVAFPGTALESAVARLDRDPDIPASVPEPLADVLRSMTHRDPAARADLPTVAIAFQASLTDALVRARKVAPTSLADDEAARVAAVRRYDILDTPEDETFDRITHLATRLLRAPVSFLSIADVDRVWVKSRQGTDLDEIDRDAALCTEPIRTGQPWAVEDVRADPLLRQNPFVASDGTVRAYAAAPLKTHDGHSIGTICVFDRRPRRFDADELADLAHLAALVMRELELRLAARRALFTSGPMRRSVGA